MLRKLCGESTLRNVVFVTNMWKEETMKVNESREKELRENFLKPALDKGAKMFRHHSTSDSAYNVLREIMKNQPVALQIQKELVDEHKAIIDTDAGGTINKEIRDLIKKHEQELKQIRDEIAEALKEKDEETRRELESVGKELEEKVTEVKKASDGLAANYAAEGKKMMAEMEEMEKRAKREREREREEEVAKRDQKLATLTERLELTPNESVSDRTELEQEIKVMRDRVTVPIYE